MNENATPSPQPTSPPASDPNPGVASIVAGFLTGAVFWSVPVIIDKTSPGYAEIPFLLFACFVLPVFGVILAVIRRTRGFGLGLLLACGIGWLVLGAICGGLLN